MKVFDMTQDLAYLVYQLDAILEASKDNKKLVENLNSLKKTLVVTTGDNYVGTAEPQLREKMADLYSKIAGSYDKPSNAELENLATISERFENAKAEFAKLSKKVDMNALQLKSFEDFIKE